jgi:hypothetical protein
MRPVLVSGVQRLLDQQAAEPGSINEQVRLDLLPIIQVQGTDESIITAQFHPHDLTFDA